MTDQDRRQQKAMLLLECQEAQQELSELEENTFQLAQRFREISDWLFSTAGEPVGGKTEADKRHTKLVHESATEVYAPHIDFVKAREAVQLVIQIRKKLTDLCARKQALGLR